MGLTRTLIQEAAQRGNVVIVGRGAVFVLGKQPGTLHVQLHADLDARVRFILSRVEELPPGEQRNTPLDEPSVTDLCKSVDSARADYIHRLYRADWLDARTYDISLDTGRLGVERTVSLLERLVGEWPTGT